MEIAGIGIFTAFIAGVISFLSPCVLPMVPGYVSYIAGKSLEDVRDDQTFKNRMQVMSLSLLFVIGFSVVFIAMGAGASAVGGLFLQYRYEGGLIAGAIIITFGLIMMGFFNFVFVNRDIRFNIEFKGMAGAGRPLGAVLLGMAFAFGWTPCIGPILGAILTMGSTTANVEQGASLLAIYAAGLAIPFLIVAMYTKHFMAKMRHIGNVGRYLQKAAGAMLIIIGIAMMTGYLSIASTWLLNNLPFLQALVI